MKTALITGAGVRLGREIALALASQGYRLALHYRSSEEPARKVAAEIGGEVCLVGADLSLPDGPLELAEQVLERFGRVDLLVNSAANFFPTPTLAEAEERWDEVMDLNVKAPLRLVRALEGSLRSQRGAVVNIADIYALRPLPQHLSYCVSKAALWSLTQGLAVQLAPDVRVNAVAPGAALLPPGAGPEDVHRLASQVPLQRLGGAEAIAQAVVYLAQAEFVTGQLIAVDGGRTLNL